MINLNRTLRIAGRSPFMGQVPAERQAAYYTKLAGLLATASDIQKFHTEYPDVAKAFGLDETSRAIGRTVAGFASIEWGAIAGSLREGVATDREIRRVDELAALIEPAEKRLIEAQKVVAERAAMPSSPFIPLFAVGVVVLVATEIFGVTNILGLRRKLW